MSLRHMEKPQNRAGIPDALWELAVILTDIADMEGDPPPPASRNEGEETCRASRLKDSLNIKLGRR